MSVPETEANELEDLQSKAYVRQRLFPDPSDPTYLHFADLRLAIEGVRSDRTMTLLDYGCGGSPYQALFPNADYHRADFRQQMSEGLDYELDEEGRINEEDAKFDFVLSTQVLEHVPNPLAYLRECYRLLKTNGTLYLTTHGMYPDHGCPKDYRRWTADGLAADLRAIGFHIRQVEKQTTGPRAFFLQLDYQIRALRAPGRSIFATLLFVLRRSYPVLKPWLNRMCDRYFAAYRVVTENLDGHVSYVVVGCLAEKR